MDGLMSLMEKSGVDRIVLFADPRYLKAGMAKYSDRLIPFLSPYGYYKIAGQKQITPETLDIAEKELKTGFYRGFGEHLLRLHPVKFAPDGVNVPPDNPVMLNVYDMAASSGLPVNLHCDAPYHKELENALSHNRRAVIIWAHCGYGDPDLIARMFDDHPNLYGDLSVLADKTKKRHRHVTTSGGILKQEWKNLFETYSDRLMVGSDVGADRSR